ncbi:MAG: cation diffusion facilitator family transporter [Vicinamibacteraceae bacterium]
MSSGHTHAHEPAASSGRLTATLVLVLAYAAAEVIGGLLSGSLALLADAGHMLSDAAALGLTLFALWFARRAPTPTRTFGYFRAEVLAALVNGSTLVGIALLIFVEAIHRLRQPSAVEGGLMLVIACGGLVINLAGLLLLRSERGGNLNMRGAWLHVLTDALGSAQAIGAAVLIWVFGWAWVDPVASIAIALLVVYSSWALLRESIGVLMEGTPANIDPDAVCRSLQAVVGVEDVHDFHLWSITSGFVALSAHLVVPVTADPGVVLRAAESCLADEFGIRHSTLQLDVGGECRQAHHDIHA